jgi:tight adherence protein C
MNRMLVLWALIAWVGATVALSELRWFARPRLADRLRPYARGHTPALVGSGARNLTPPLPTPDGAPPGRGLLSAASIREVLGPISQTVGERIARVFGISEHVGTRLARVHSSLDAAGFRVRQLGWSGAGLGLGLLVTAGLRPPLLIGTLAVGGLPLLFFLVVEQRLAGASAAWQEQVTLELPVVSEQLAMLLGAGYSLGAALNRLAARGRGACAQDLTIVCNRMRQGLSANDALHEWAAIVRVDAVDRLVPVLALNSEASDLGRLVSEEARAIRRDVQRHAVETMERRGQQVWVPVTVATLVPGVVLLAVPFLQALRLFSGS